MKDVLIVPTWQALASSQRLAVEGRADGAWITDQLAPMPGNRSTLLFRD